MKNFKKTLAFIFFLLVGIVLGAFLAYLCKGKSGLDWLSWGKSVGVENFAVDFSVIKFHIGFMINVTISQIIMVAISLIVYAKTCKNL